MYKTILLPVLGILASGFMADSARILAIIPILAKGHHTIIQPILRALADAGHQVVTYSPLALEPPHPNYTDVLLEDIVLPNIDQDNSINEMINVPHWKCLDNILPFHDQFLYRVFQNIKIHQLMRSREKFDVLFTEPFLAQEFALVFGHIFNIPTIGIQTSFTTNLQNLHLGNSLSIATIPDACFPYSDQMTFAQRFINFVCQMRGIYMYYYEYIPLLERKLRKYIPNAPPILEMTKNISLMFINDHLTADYARPRPQTMIPVAGIHINPSQPLPQNIKKFMDEATDGVILFSMGSLVPDNTKPQEYFDIFIKVFKKLSQRVLWKTNKENIKGVSPNVMLIKWMPQRDVLAHPKCVLFITHGGIASQHETIYNGVPVVGIPHYNDQHRNVAFYVAKEIGVRLLLNEISEETVLTAVTEVLENPKYKENIKKLSRILNDQPMTPAQSVVFWTEYVLRHGGAAHLKPASTQLKLYQLALLDVIAVVVVFFSLSTAVYFCLRKIVCLIKGKPKTNIITKEKEN